MFIRAMALALILSLTSIWSEEQKVPIPATPPNTAPIAPPVISLPPAGLNSIAPVPPSTIPRPPQSPSAQPRPLNQEWSSLLERLRVQPRAGDISNGAVSACVVDIFSDSADAKAKTLAIQGEYEKALLERGAKWEVELKELRNRFEERVLQEVPEAKRESAGKLLAASRAAWASAAERDAKTRAEFLQKMRSGTQPIPPRPGIATPAAPSNPQADASIWMRDERAKAVKQDADSVLQMRALLEKEDAGRFDRFDRSRQNPLIIRNTDKVPQLPLPPAPAPQPPPPVPSKDKQDGPGGK